jgi:protein-S-isoprenylcysteine O-methyltransferase Ste14
MKRTFALIYGVSVYASFLFVFLYAVGWIGDFAVPNAIDGPIQVPFAKALMVNLGLLGLFAVQHSVMARPAFKRWWTKFVAPPVERSTYVLATNLAMGALFAFWQPMGGIVWDVQAPMGRGVLWALYATGWLIVLATTFMIDHFELFGLKQVWRHFRGEPQPKASFVTPGAYRIVRHPLYVGWITAFWATPTMTAAHLVFALATTAYILVAIGFEERDLIAEHGARYIAYRKRVPKLVPRLTPKAADEEVAAP